MNYVHIAIEKNASVRLVQRLADLNNPKEEAILRTIAYGTIRYIADKVNFVHINTFTEYWRYPKDEIISGYTCQIRSINIVKD